MPVSFVPEVQNPLCLPAPPEASEVNGKKVFVLGSFSEVSTRRRGVRRDRKPVAGAVWKQLYSTEPSKGDEDDLPRDQACMYTHTHTQACSSWRTLQREKATPVWNISQQVCTRGQSSTPFYFFTCFLQLAGNFWSCGGLVWLCFRARLVCLHIQYNTTVDALMLGRCYWYARQGVSRHTRPSVSSV